MLFAKPRWKPKWAALVMTGALLTSMLSPALPAARAEESAAASPAAHYSDLSASYAAKEIASLTASGILDGFGDGTFRPTERVTRAQFAKVIASILKLKAEPEIASRFHDVPADSWYAGYTGALVKEGITDGVSDNEFAPEQWVTREELAAFFMRALKLSEAAQSLPVDSSSFADFNDISPWARQYVSFAYKIEFLQGSQDDNGKLLYRPKAEADRQALARLAYELLENKDTYLDKAAALAPAASATPSPSPSPSAAFGGGGFGGGAPGTPKPSATPTPGPVDGSTLTDLPAGNYSGSFTVAAGVTIFGPQTGTAAISGTLIVNPGPSGEVTLRNIQAVDLRVLSGSDHSVILQGVKVSGSLTVNTGSQGTPVRILVQSGTAIARTLVESAAILEASAGSAGEVIIPSSAAGKTIELRGSINGTVRSQAADASILVRDGASVQSLIMEANGRVQADGNVSGYGILNPNVEVELSGAKVAVLKENTGKAAKESIQALGDTSKLVLADQAKVLQAVSQYNALVEMNMADAINAQLKNQLQAAQIQMKALTKDEAVNKLSELPADADVSWMDIYNYEEAIAAAQQAVDAAINWGNQTHELSGYYNWSSLKSFLDLNYIHLYTGTLVGDMAIYGKAQPGVKIALEKFTFANGSSKLFVTEAVPDEYGIFMLYDPSIFPLKAGDSFSLKAQRPGSSYSVKKSYTVTTSTETTVAPAIIQPYYQGDPIKLDYGNNQPQDQQFILVVNEKGQVILHQNTYSYTGASLYPNGAVQSTPGEILTAYARSMFQERNTSAPVRFQVQSASGISQQPEISDVYAGDFLMNVGSTAGALVTLVHNGETVQQVANLAGLATIQIADWNLNPGDQVTVTVKETGKNPSTPLTIQAKTTSGKTQKPAANVSFMDRTVVIEGSFPNYATLLLEWPNSNGAKSLTYQLGAGPNGSYPFKLMLGAPEIYGGKVIVYAKVAGKAKSDPQELSILKQTSVSSISGIVYTDSVNLKVTADNGSVVTLKKQDGSVIYRQQGDQFSNIVLLDSIHLNTLLVSGETIYLTATAPGKAPSAVRPLKVQANQGKTKTPLVVAGTLLKQMEAPVLSILSDVYKFGVQIKSTDTNESIWYDPAEDFGGRYRVDQHLINGSSRLLVSIKEHGKDPSDPVEVSVYNDPHAAALKTVTQTVYRSTNAVETIRGSSEPFAVITVTNAAGQIVTTNTVDAFGLFQIGIPNPSLVPETSLYLTAQLPGFAPSQTVTLAVYAAQEETPKPIVPQKIVSGGTNIKLEMEAPAGSHVAIYNQAGELLDSGDWIGQPGDNLEKSTISLNVKQLNQNLKVTAQLPGRNPSQVEFYVEQDWLADTTTPPVVTSNLYDYPGGIVTVTGHTAKPFTLLKGGVIDTYSDKNGNFVLYAKGEPGTEIPIEALAPGENSVFFYVRLPMEIMDSDNGSEGGIGGGGGASSEAGADQSAGTTHP